MPSRLIAVVLLVLVVASASAQDESLADKNKDDIVKHEDILKDKVATDLQELKTKIKQPWRWRCSTEGPVRSKCPRTHLGLYVHLLSYYGHRRFQL